MECAFCKADFESKRADAKYCSAMCRAYASRIKRNSKPEVKRNTVKRNSPDIDLLKAWARGEGSRYQQYLGTIGRQYSVINSRPGLACAAL